MKNKIIYFVLGLAIGLAVLFGGILLKHKEKICMPVVTVPFNCQVGDRLNVVYVSKDSMALKKFYR